MSVSYVAIGTGTDSSTATLSLPMPGGVAPTSGNLIIAMIGFWNESRTPPALNSAAVTAGWQKVTVDTTGTNGGGGTYGLDAGPRDVAAYWKVSDGTETSVGFDLTVDADGIGDGCRGYTMTFSKTLAGWATPVAVAGADNTSGTAFSCTGSSDPGGLNGDMLAVGAVNIPDTATQGSPAVSYASGTYTQRGSGAATAGHDARHNCGTSTVTATSSGAPVFTATLSAAGTGAVLFVRLRDSSSFNGSVVAVPATGTAQAEAPGVEGETVIDGGGAAAGSATVRVPVISAGSTVTGVAATASASVAVPTVGAGAGIAVPTPAVAGQAVVLAPSISLGPGVVAPAAAAAAHVLSPSVEAINPSLYYFTPPTYEENINGRGPIRYWRITRAMSIVRINGTFTTVRSPHVSTLTGTEGEDFFIGGHNYIVPLDLAQELEAAGFDIGEPVL